MGAKAKQTAIYISLLLVFMTYTLISPFYPGIARSKGVPIWLIGVIFSVNPLSSLLTSIFLGKYMVKIGRKLVVVASYIFVAVSMIFLAPIEDVELVPMIVLSLISRVLGGMGQGCILTSITTIFISDFPDRIQTMIGRMEASIGVGLIMGPLLGTGLFLINLLVALIIVGAAIFMFSPLAWRMLGTFREYEIHDIQISRTALLLKPVKFT